LLFIQSTHFWIRQFVFLFVEGSFDMMLTF
jgi:hypothetical protein